jgi:hypothetical protein
LSGNISYAATPERVVGLCGFIGDLIATKSRDAYSEIDDVIDDFTSGIRRLAPGHILSRMSMTNWSRCAVVDNIEDTFREEFGDLSDGLNDKDFIGYLSKIFSGANAKGIDADKGIVLEFFDGFMQDILSLRKKIKDKALVDNASRLIIYKFVYSSENVCFDSFNSSRIKGDVLDFAKNFEISSANILERAMRDMVLNRQDYCRQILAKFVDEIKAEDYGFVMDCAKRKLADRRERLAKLEGLTPKYSGWDYICKGELKLIAEAEELIRLVVSEKRFIEKFLSS